MNYEHRAIIERCKRDGSSPMETAKELLGHDLLKAMISCISGHAVAFNKMTEQQQDAAIHDMQNGMKKAVDTAIGVIASQNTKTVRMKLKGLAIGKDWKITGTANADEEHLHELADKAQDSSDVLIVLYERDYLQGLDAIQGEKDQKELPIETTSDQPGKGGKAKKADPKPAAQPKAKEIELTPGLIGQAQEFVQKFQNATHAGLQNQLKIGFDKAEALLAKLEETGHVTAADKDGNRTVIRAEQPKKEAQPEQKSESAIPTDDDGFVVMSDELFEAARSKVVKEQKFSKGALAVSFDLDDKVVQELITRLESEGVISEADEMGGREVYELPD